MLVPEHAVTVTWEMQTEQVPQTARELTVKLSRLDLRRLSQLPPVTDGVALLTDGNR